MASICLSGALFFVFWVFFGLGRLRSGGVGVRWVSCLLTPQAAQLSQLLPLSPLLISLPYPSASSTLYPIHPWVSVVWLSTIRLPCYKEPFRGQSRFRSCFKLDAVGSQRPQRCHILSDSRGFFPSIPESLQSSMHALILA